MAGEGGQLALLSYIPEPCGHVNESDCQCSSIRREGYGIYNSRIHQCRNFLACIYIPDPGSLILTPGCQLLAVGRERNRIDLVCVFIEGCNLAPRSRVP